ncbi:MAG: hypothetical protein ACRC68_06810 [Clostridium sp.]
MDDKIIELLIELKEGQTKLQEGQLNIIERLDILENKVDSVATETANLMEFRTEITNKVDNLQQKYNFQTHKLTETEEDLFEIKSHLKIVK